MNEKEGCEILKRVFTQAGLLIQEGFALHGEGVQVHLDGFDPACRVGYEFLTTESGSRAEVTPDVVRLLDQKMEQGTLYVFLIDEADVPDETALTKAAERFLSTLKQRGILSS